MVIFCRSSWLAMLLTRCGYFFVGQWHGSSGSGYCSTGQEGANGYMVLMSCALLCLLLMMLRKNEKQELATSGERKTSVVSLVLGVESARMCATTVCLRLVCEREDGFLSLFFIRLSSVLVHIVAHRWLRLAGISSASSPACLLACMHWRRR